MLPRLTPLCLCGALVLSPLLALAVARGLLRQIGVARTSFSVDSSLMDFTSLAARHHSSLALHVSRTTHHASRIIPPFLTLQT